MRAALLLLKLSLVLPVACAVADRSDADAPMLLRSPDGRVQVAFALPRAGSTDLPTWSATFAGRPVLAGCRLGLTPVGDTDLLAGAQRIAMHAREHGERIAVRFGKADHAEDRFVELRLLLQRGSGMPVHVVFRCYDDAIALRYELERSDACEMLRLQDQGTSFQLVGDPQAYVQYLENDHTSHEHPVATTSWRTLAPGMLIDMPATFAFGDGPYLSITEAALRHYAGMSLWRDHGAADLVAKLTPRPDGSKVVRPLPLATPWRVVLLGDRPGALLESNTLYCLNDPPETDDLGWIHPGKMTWPWWNGYLIEAQRQQPILSLAANRKYIDFCAENGIAYHAVVADESDTPWYLQSRQGLFPGPDTDATRVRQDLDLPAIKAYAAQRGVGLWTWVHHAAVRGRVEPVFAAFEQLGWNGVMVDFLDSDDQDTVEFAEDVLRAAARHHLLVHFHGMYKPTGWQRTFPNLMNHEGALNLEYLKWTDRCTPAHDLLIAFTRLVAGPTDYHLGGFRAVRRPDFVPRNIGPNVLGTRGHQLALYVCFDNPNPMVADYPAAYRGQPGFDCITAVPTYWDQTRVLDAEIGSWLLTARRRGTAWWLGGLGAGAARQVSLPLSFLGDGNHELQLWHDAPECDTDPNRLTVTHRTVTAGDVLQLPVAADGGFVARLLPAGR